MTSKKDNAAEQSLIYCFINQHDKDEAPSYSTSTAEDWQ